MRGILIMAIIVGLGVRVIQAGDAPTNAPSYSTEGSKKSDYSETGRFVLRQVTIDGSDQGEAQDIFIPIMQRKGGIYLSKSDTGKLLAIRLRIAEYRTKVDELQKLGASIKSDYLSIIANSTPMVSP